MSAEIVNLRRARKARDRKEREAEAAENRARFGRSKSERGKAEVEADLAARRLDNLQREGRDGNGGGDGA